VYTYTVALSPHTHYKVSNTVGKIKQTWEKQIYSPLLHVSGLQDHLQWQYSRKWLKL